MPGFCLANKKPIRVRLLYLHNGMVLRPKIHVAVGASVGMMLPSNVYVGPKARPYGDFLAQKTWKFDPQPLRQSAHWSNAGPGYAKVPASFKQYTFEEISLPVQQYPCCRPSSRQVQRFEPFAPCEENLIRDQA